MVPVSFKDITKRLKNSVIPETDMVIGIGTGGIVPASLVAYQLGCELKILPMNFRNAQNTPQHPQPVVLLKPTGWNIKGLNILLVDDVSVSGKTLEEAKKHLAGGKITTLTMKGKADIVLFPEIQDCVQWPWKL